MQQPREKYKTIVEDIAAGTNIARRALLAATKIKIQNQSGEPSYERPYLDYINLPTAPLTSGWRSRSPTMVRDHLL